MTRREKILKVAGVADDAVIPAGYLEQLVKVINDVELESEGECEPGIDDDASAAAWLDEENDAAEMNRVEALAAVTLMHVGSKKDGKLGGPMTVWGDIRESWQAIVDKCQEELAKAEGGER